MHALIALTEKFIVSARVEAATARSASFIPKHLVADVRLHRVLRLSASTCARRTVRTRSCSSLMRVVSVLLLSLLGSNSRLLV